MPTRDARADAGSGKLGADLPDMTRQNAEGKSPEA